MEYLESRIAPAAILTFVELDGDSVTIKTSKGTNDKLMAAAHLSGMPGAQTLDLLDLAHDPYDFFGTDITITAKKAGAGDGFANVGRINALRNDGTWMDVGKVSVQGNLGEIDAGDEIAKTPGVKSLTVGSMDITTVNLAQSGGDGVTKILGLAPSIKVTGNVKQASLQLLDAGTVSIGGALIGGAADDSGLLSARTVAKLTIKGGLTGAEGAHSGSVYLYGGPNFYGELPSGNVVLGPVQGGGGSASGSFGTSDGVKSLQVNGTLTGGGGTRSGELLLGYDLLGDVAADPGLVKIGKLVVTGAITGGSVDESGGVFAIADVGQLTIGGVVLATAFDDAGYVSVNGNVGKFNLQAVIGASQTYVSGAQIFAKNVTALTMSNGIQNGADIFTSSIGKFTFTGDLAGSDTDRATISTAGNIGSVAIKGNVAFADILAGYDVLKVAKNPDAQIGAVTVTGNWTASNLVAGVDAGNGKFGDADDTFILNTMLDRAPIVSAIKSIVIKGALTGTAGGTDHYGFVAQLIGSLKVGTTKFALSPGAFSDLAGQAVGASGDVRIREIVAF